MIIRTSALDSATMVIELELGDDGDLVEMMDVRQNGFAVMGEDIPLPLAVIDGRLRTEPWFTEDHLIAIEAHELGHIRTGSCDEPTAEREGIRLLDAAGFVGAADILRDRGIA